MTNDLDAWLSAILAKPDDRTIRLTFADWLEERGDERAAQVRDFLRWTIYLNEKMWAAQLPAHGDRLLAMFEHSRCLVCDGKGHAPFHEPGGYVVAVMTIAGPAGCHDCRGLGHLDDNDPPVHVFHGTFADHALAGRYYRQGANYLPDCRCGRVCYGGFAIAFDTTGPSLGDYEPVLTGLPHGFSDIPPAHDQHMATICRMAEAFRRRWDGRLDELVRQHESKCEAEQA